MSTTDSPETRSRLWLVLLPVILFAALAALFWKGLSGTPNEIPSALINKPVPDFVLNPVDGMNLPGFAGEDLKKGKVTVVNVWASWCAPCRIEHPLLAELAKRPDIQLFGMNYKDEPQNAVEFLNTLGQPFAAIGMDRDGRTAIDFGVYGVPETFIVDGQGMIRYKHIGPLTAETIAQEMAREIEKARTPLTANGS
ncbi:MAG: DsbE family thiol:disulfide interchange protein [Aestuariivirga sp.]|uniref:DsbE family thiol:disulfide interchange protein n=1 Tax=Aestuariivirga sp. TaxID=2650926 RepID=UPI0025C72C6C|nr:DsbE family thiol:disulfide interchange protein [Aestuariivirga sp.]MCA3560374.1 DsbE family thiol:disulfide interchange protein [Aestuariivirga sp.]